MAIAFYQEAYQLLAASHRISTQRMRHAAVLLPQRFEASLAAVASRAAISRFLWRRYLA